MDLTVFLPVGSETPRTFAPVDLLRGVQTVKWETPFLNHP